VVDAYGGRDGEKELRSRLKHRRSLEVRELEPGERQEYQAKWDAAQATFVRTPSSGLHDAAGRDQISSAVGGGHGNAESTVARTHHSGAARRTLRPRPRGSALLGRGVLTVGAQSVRERAVAGVIASTDNGL